ncbi:MAG TPA: bacterial transcriptional activator domain-containing protein, partial [Syntrophobacteraceae bacterium]|nr:bacterial transcriptional activator domain-containing protein [Syntrophobacteraceae bacterium]
MPISNRPLPLQECSILRDLNIDDLSEEFYQRLMICHQRLGRHTNVLEVYNRCKKLLSLNMGIEPSEKTKA